MRVLFLLIYIVTLISNSSAQNPYDIIVPIIRNKSPQIENNQKFSSLFPFINPLDWKPGMRFMPEAIRDKSSGYLSTIKLVPYRSKIENTSKINQKDFQWKTFIYKGLEFRSVKCPRGICQRKYWLFECEKKIYEFEFIADTSDLRGLPQIHYINNLVYIDEIDSVKSHLIGKKVFVKTHLWMRDDPSGQGVFTFSNSKYIPITITSVGLGTQDGPLKIVFKPDGTDEEAYINTRLSGINSVPGGLGFFFDDVFLLNDPKLEYPDISEKTWLSIQYGKVSMGMSKNEAELSWGKPKQINKTVSNEINMEQWVYNPRKILYFSSGILETIQN